MPESASYAKGLEGVIAGESEICRIDGQNGRLYYRGYSIEELARESDFEETTYLLLHGKLPNRQELAEFAGKMRASRSLSEPVLAMVRAFPRGAHPMELLQSVIAYLSGYVEHTHPPLPHLQLPRHPAPGGPAGQRGGRLPALPGGPGLRAAPPGPLPRGELPVHAAGQRSPRSTRGASWTPAWCCTPSTASTPPPSRPAWWPPPCPPATARSPRRSGPCTDRCTAGPTSG